MFLLFALGLIVAGAFIFAVRQPIIGFLYRNGVLQEYQEKVRLSKEAFSLADWLDYTAPLDRLAFALMKLGTILVLAGVPTIFAPFSRGLAAKLNKWAESNLAVVLVIVGGYLLALMTTPQIAFGRGVEGLGYGHDGLAYGAIAEQWQQAVVGRVFSYRVLPSLVVRWLGLGTFAGFKMLNFFAYVTCCVMMYRLLRCYNIERGWAVLGMAFFVALKFGVKFWVYYPVLTDATGMALLLLGLWAIVTRRSMVYVMCVMLGILCRENLLVLVPFHLLFTLRWSERRRDMCIAGAILVDAVLAALFLVYKRFPFLEGHGTYSATSELVYWVRRFFTEPRRPLTVLLALVNCLGALLMMPFTAHRQSAVFIKNHYYWGFFLLANVVLAAVGGMDTDRFMMYLAPGLCVLSIHAAKSGFSQVAVAHLFLLQLAWSESLLPWAPDARFYYSLYAAYATKWSLIMMILLCAVFSAAAIRIVRFYMTCSTTPYSPQT